MKYARLTTVIYVIAISVSSLFAQNNNPLKGDSTEPGRGHNGFYTEHDTMFIVYHAYTRSANGAPLLHIRPVYTGKDGWPTMEPTGRLFKRED